MDEDPNRISLKVLWVNKLAPLNVAHGTLELHPFLDLYKLALYNRGRRISIAMEIGQNLKCLVQLILRGEPSRRPRK